jgi:hypothetical protein
VRFFSFFDIFIIFSYFLRAIIQALYGASERLITADQQAKMLQQVVALRRLIARRMMRAYTLDYTEEQRRNATEIAELDRETMEKHRIRYFPAYLDYMMNPPNQDRGTTTTYANADLEGQAAAVILQRTIIFENVRYDEEDSIVERTASIYSRKGLKLVRIYIYTNIYI